jgi:hypothetical protein
MKKTLFWLNLLAVCAILMTAAVAVEAQNTRSWVSGVGNDANACSRTAPCATFAGALVKTLAGGEINALDEGGFGPVTINKAITIDGGSSFAGITAAGTVNGVTVAAGNTDVVVLRRLTINGQTASTPAGANGVRFNSGAALIIEDCVIENFDDHNINFVPTGGLGASGPHRLYIKNTSSINSTNGAGVHTKTVAGDTIVAVIENCSLNNNVAAVLAEDGTVATIRGTTATGRVGNTNIAVLPQASFGFWVNADALPVEMNVIDSSATNCLTGIRSIGVAIGSAIIRLSGSQVLNNTFGLSNSATGQIISFGNNAISGNGTNGAPTSVVPPS